MRTRSFSAGDFASSSTWHSSWMAIDPSSVSSSGDVMGIPFVGECGLHTGVVLAGAHILPRNALCTAFMMCGRREDEKEMTMCCNERSCSRARGLVPLFQDRCLLLIRTDAVRGSVFPTYQ